VEADEHEGVKSMGKVIWHVTMSLDGFIADADDSVAPLVAGATGTSELGDEIVRTTGVFMAGGRMFPDDDIGGIYGGDWDGEVFVYTRNARQVPDGARYRYVSGDIRKVVEQALAAAGDKNVVVSGGTVPGLCVEAGLVDEIAVHLAPVLLGDGVRFFKGTGQGPIGLEKISVAEPGQGTDLHFRVKR
jgi:riboflavin biosynthesis pyrimidine reductase